MKQAFTENPFFEFWKESQETFLKSQTELANTWFNTDDPVMGDFLENSKKSWALCEEQYNSWMKTAENWLPTASLNAGQDEAFNANQALQFMLDPANFSKFSFDQMNSFFGKLIDGPEFADIGMFEKKYLKSGQDWLALCAASDEYQSILASAWNRAFKLYSDELLDQVSQEPKDSKALLDKWLEIADAELVSTLRSEDFLEAQRNFFKAGTAYKLRQQEFIEMWCESHAIPTRSEVDDLHKTIAELRGNLRAIKQEIKNLTPAKQLAVKKSKTTTTKTPTK